MSTTKYAIGVDFGTESGRAVLVEVASGREVATSVYPYQHGVIDEKLPLAGQEIRLDPDWALQDPQDYIRTFQNAIPAVVRNAGIDPEDVIGVGIDFTACTMLPVKADGTPLCDLPEYRANPHAWVKLWKHHAAQPEADKINATARQLGEAWLDRYGGKISSEWFFSKTLQILDEAPEIYAAADRLLEAADWVVWQLTGEEKRNSCTAGYKAIWSKRQGFPRPAYFAALDSRLEDVVATKMTEKIYPIGDKAGELTPQAAGWTGLRPGTAGPDGDDHGHQHLSHGAGHRGAPGAGHLRLRRRRHHPWFLRLRGRAIVRGRSLRLVRGELRAGGLRTPGYRARPEPPPAVGGESRPA
jgi:L-ribulokinase